MKTHIIENGVIVNTIQASLREAEETFPEAICRDASLGGNVGDGYDPSTDTILVLQPQLSPEQLRRQLLEKLQEIDRKTPRAVREALLTGNNTRVEQLELEAEALRSQLNF